jgi:hypothetical protein
MARNIPHENMLAATNAIANSAIPAQSGACATLLDLITGRCIVGRWGKCPSPYVHTPVRS